jgi:hypothetical protein
MLLFGGRRIGVCFSCGKDIGSGYRKVCNLDWKCTSFRSSNITEMYTERCLLMLSMDLHEVPVEMRRGARRAKGGTLMRGKTSKLSSKQPIWARSLLPTVNPHLIPRQSNHSPNVHILCSITCHPIAAEQTAFAFPRVSRLCTLISRTKVPFSTL